MYCSTCLGTYEDKFADCPICRRNSLATAPAIRANALPRRNLSVQTVGLASPSETDAGRRIVEFPNRVADSRPQWRQEVSARLREFQQRRETRAADAPLPPPQVERREIRAAAPAEEAVTLGVVSLSNRKELDPLVVRALQRIERARQKMNRHPLTACKGFAAALQAEEEELALAPEVAAPPARPALKAVPSPALEPNREDLPGEVIADADSFFQEELDDAEWPISALSPDVKISSLIEFTEAADEAETVAGTEEAEEFFQETLTVWEDREAVAPAPSVEMYAESPLAEAPRPAAAPRKVCAEVIDDAYLERKEAARAAAIQEKRRQVALAQGLYDDFAPAEARVVAAVVDWALAFAASLPMVVIATKIEPNWQAEVLFQLLIFSMVLFMALYSIVMTAYLGRTWGQELMFLGVARVDDGEAPSLTQCLVRSVAYLLWPVTLGASLLYALWDAEGRALHDKLSGTIVVRS